MRQPRGVRTHKTAPSAVKRVPNITGDMALDQKILRNPNPDMAAKLKARMNQPGTSYGQRTGYDGYTSHGDD